MRKDLESTTQKALCQAFSEKIILFSCAHPLDAKRMGLRMKPAFADPKTRAFSKKIGTDALTNVRHGNICSLKNSR